MLTLMTPHRDLSARSEHGVIGSLVTAIKRLLVRLRFNREAGSLSDEAIAILCDDASAADMRDWAERFLSGMITSDAATYLERRRRWQS